MKKLIILFITLLLITGCSKNTDVKTYNMFYMDTYIEVKLYDVLNSKKIFDEIDNMYKSYHELTDRYNAYDNIKNVYYLNEVLKTNESIEIDSRLSAVINYGLSMYSKTNGYVDIAIGNVVDVWKSYREIGSGVPTLYELMDSGSIKIEDIKLKDNMYSKTSDVKIDLGAVAKGYVTELVGKYIESKGCNKYLINAGGNIKVGNSYKSTKYKIGIETPFNTSKVYKVLNVENTSIVTSGSYQRYYEYNGVIYNHIINPNTLFPENYIKSVTVITKDSGYADILSTYLFLLPIKDGIKYINSLSNVEAIWYADKIYYSDGFDKYE
jgi:thiamine biosynthesis lipoprotein